MLALPINKLKASNKIEQEKIDLKDKEDIKRFRDNILKELETIKTIPEIKALTIDIYPLSQKISEYSHLPYGNFGTVKEAGCGPLALEYALRVQKYNINFKEILDECVKKDYRAYVYDDEGKIIDGCGTYNNLFSDVGIELKSIKEIFEYLQNNSPVTLLINYDETIHTSNHFVTLIGIEDNKLIIMDGNLIQTNEKEALIKLDFYENITKIKGAWSYSKNKLDKFITK